jgi:hypothetical protein
MLGGHRDLALRYVVTLLLHEARHVPERQANMTWSGPPGWEEARPDHYEPPGIVSGLTPLASAPTRVGG